MLFRNYIFEYDYSVDWKNVKVLDKNIKKD